MKTKKIICGVLICALAMSLLAGCSKPKNTDESILTATDIAMQQIEGSKLTEDEMFEVIQEYYNVFNAIFEQTGENIVAEAVKNSNKSIEINTTRPELDAEGKATGKTVTDKAIFSWKTVKEAFAYLYEQQQVDLEGNILFSKDDILSQSSQSNDSLLDNNSENDIESDTDSETDREDSSTPPESGTPSLDTAPSESESGEDATSSQAANG